jgi:hypothetical protein
MRAGAAVTSITPRLEADRPVWMAGFEPGRRATEVLDELTARALIVEVGGRRFALVTVDLIGLFRDEIERVRADPTVQRLGLDHLVVAATHTHAGPDTLGLWGPGGRSGVDPAYLVLVRSRIVEVLEAAAAALRPAELLAGEASPPGLIRDTVAPLCIDERLVALQLRDPADGTSITSLVHWANHAEVLWSDNRGLSADFPGALRSAVEEEAGGVCLFVAGAIGGLMTPDQVPVIDPRSGQRAPERSLAKVEALGHLLARHCREALAAAVPTQPAALELRVRRFEVSLANPRLRLGVERGQLRRDGFVRSGEDWFLESEVSLIRLGPVALLAVPGELYPELVIGGVLPPREGENIWRHPPLLERTSARHLFVIGLANDELGYIVPPTHWARDSGEIHTTGPDLAEEVFGALDLVLDPSIPLAPQAR